MSENERLEAVQQALWDMFWLGFELSGDLNRVPNKPFFTDKAAAALAAADQYGIDAALDGFPHGADIGEVRGAGSTYLALIHVYAADYGYRPYEGTGPTRTAAILSACAKAKEQS